ncbi:magnesium transporter [soil metagenome]
MTVRLRAPEWAHRNLIGPAAAREVLGFWSRERRTLRQGFTALGISTGVGLSAGLVLGSMQGLLARLPGLLVLVPAAIGMRGAIFGALGARLGTGILTGQFTPGLRRGELTGDNVAASALLTLSSSALAAVAARATAAAFGLETISLWHLMVVSMVGGVLSSAFVLVGVLLLARTALSRGWDMDAVGSPIITATGDVVTLPALVVATLLLGDDLVTAALGGLLSAAAVAALVVGLRSPAPTTRRVVRESASVLAYAAVVDILAGTVLETRLETLLTNPALLVLVPPFIANCGSLGGILSSRLGSDLHLGLLRPRRWPEALAGLEASIIVLFSLAAFSGVGLIAHVGSRVAGLGSPGAATMVGVALGGGLLALAPLFTVAYYSATATYRYGLDPDNFGIPIVTATMDFCGVLCLVAATALLGVT